MNAGDRDAQIDAEKALRRREDRAFGMDAIDFRGCPVSRATAFLLARALGYDKRCAELMSTDRKAPHIRLRPAGTVTMSFSDALAALKIEDVRPERSGEVPNLKLTPTL